MSLMAVRSHSVRLRPENLWMRSDAGPLASREFLSAYISGYADGEHRSRLGLIGIVSIVRDMNADGRRRYDADELVKELVRAVLAESQR